MFKKILVALVLLTPAVSAFAQPEAAAQEQYGDRQAGNFGDPEQGYFGNPGDGEFTRHNFRRDQEGSVTPTPGIPKRFRGVEPPPRMRATELAKPTEPNAPTPYVTLERPPGEQRPPEKKPQQDKKRR